MRWLIIAVLCCTTSANAASFDCKLAKSLRERAICANPDLCKADDDLASAYAKAQSKASAAYRTELRDAQRLWLVNTDTLCAIGQSDPKNDGLKSCLLSAVQERTKLLGNSVLKFGRFVFTQSWYERVKPDPDNDNKANPNWRFGSDETIWPRIETPADDHTAAFNVWVRTKLSLNAPSEMDPSQNQTTSLTPIAANETVITLGFNNFFYGHGAAHGNYSETTLYWLVGENRELRASDIFVGNAWQAPLARKVEAAFKADTGEESWAKPEDMAEMVASPENWKFTKDHMIFVFQPYAIASYAEGIVEVKLPWHEVAPWLVKNSALRDALKK